MNELPLTKILLQSVLDVETAAVLYRCTLVRAGRATLKISC